VGAERWDEQVGSVADEATRLLESLRRSAAEAAEAGDRGPRAGSEGAPPASAADAGSAAPPRPDDVEPDAGTHEPACQWCPLCRSAAVVRSLSPQTLDRLADLAGLAATVLADLASTRGAADGSASDRGPPVRGRQRAGQPSALLAGPGRAPATIDGWSVTPCLSPQVPLLHQR